MKTLIRYILFVVIIAIPLNTYSQKKNKGQNPKKAAKEQIEKQEQKKKDGEIAIANAKKKHAKIQTKETQKRMKQNRKRSRNYHENKDNIFRRIFKKKR